MNDNTRIIFTPDINIVTKDAADQVVDTYDIIDEIGFSASTGMIAVTRAENSDWDGNQVYTVALDSPTPTSHCRRYWSGYIHDYGQRRSDGYS